MEALRGKDIFSPEEVLWAVVEPNGHISTACKPKDTSPAPMLPILLDDALYQENLEALHLEESWIDQVLQEHGLQRHQVLILLYNGKDVLLVPKKGHPKNG